MIYWEVQNLKIVTDRQANRKLNKEQVQKERLTNVDGKRQKQRDRKKCKACGSKLPPHMTADSEQTDK